MGIKNIQGDLKVNGSPVITESSTIITATYSTPYYRVSLPNSTVTTGFSFTLLPLQTNIASGSLLMVNNVSKELVRLKTDGSGVAKIPSNWFKVNTPYRVLFNGTYWVVVDYPAPVVEYEEKPVDTNILKGVWEFNKVISNFTSLPSIDVNFSYNGIEYNRMYYDNPGQSDWGIYRLLFQKVESGSITRSDPVYTYNPADKGGFVAGWATSTRRVTFTSETNISPGKFWIQGNATKISELPDANDSIGNIGLALDILHTTASAIIGGNN